MRKLLTAENRENAESIRWYLESQGVESWIDEEDPEDCTVWLINEEQEARAHTLAKEALAPGRQKENSQLIREAKSELEKKQKSDKKRAAAQKKSQNTGLFGQFPVTIYIMIICVTVFMINESSGQSIIYQKLHFSLNPYSHYWTFKNFDEILNGEVWRLITPAFLHFGWFHIIFNMMWFWQLGTATESSMSTKKLLSFFFWVAVISNTGFYLVAGPMFGGMSGINYALCGWLWGLERFGKGNRVSFNQQTPTFFFFWYIICLGLSLTGMFNVANTIHGLGAVTGVFFAMLSSGGIKQIPNMLKFNKPFIKEAGIGLGLLIAGILVDHFSY